MSDIKELMVFSLRNTIFLRGVRTSSLMDNATISAKGTKRGLDKLESVIRMKNLRCSRILSYTPMMMWVIIVTTSERLQRR